ncbi:MAG: hypothetical protein M1339_05085 [Bacteroidetes bacterium]|nr:hypothetical protein [Bacteroidota bacterium]
MNGKSVILFSAVLLLGIVCYKVVFVPTSLSMHSFPEQIFVSSATPVTVKATLIDRLGLPVPFERLEGKFVVDQGGDKINVVQTKSDELVFTTKGSAGRLVIYFYSTKIPFPVEIVLNIKESAMASLI